MKRKQHISKLKPLHLFLAIFIFLVTSIIFYAFLYMTRESIRIISSISYYDIWILTDQEVTFYNRFFASISLIFGMGNALAFYSNRPSFYNRSITERTRTFLDATHLNWVFIAWGFKLAMAFGIFFIATTYYYEVSLYPSFRFLFILLVIVLYLQLWTNSRRQFMSFTKKAFLPTSLLFIIFTVLLGSVNFIDYRAINEQVLSKNPIHVLNIKKPSATYNTSSNLGGYTKDLYVSRSESGQKKNTRLMLDDALEIELTDLDAILKNWRKNFLVHNRPGLKCKLTIDKNVLMHNVNQLKDSILKSGIHKIEYAIAPENAVHQQQFKHAIIPARLFDFNMISELFPHRLENKKVYKIRITKTEILINGKVISSERLETFIENILKKSTDYHFDIVYDDSIRYQKFIDIYALLYRLIQEGRDQIAREKFGKNYHLLSKVDQKEIQKRIPFSIEDTAYQTGR